VLTAVPNGSFSDGLCVVCDGAVSTDSRSSARHGVSL